MAAHLLWVQQRQCSGAANENLRQVLFFYCKDIVQQFGPGDFFGARQHGLPTLRVADFTCDMELLYEAQGAAEALLALDPRLEGHPALHARVRELFDLNAEALN